MPYLIQRKANGQLVQLWQLGEQPQVFGRGPEADVTIDDPEMSKRHFIVGRRGTTYYLRDLQSTNGTWVNKQKITDLELTPGLTLRAGDTHFAFEKGLGTVIGELEQNKQSYGSALREITKTIADKKPRV